MDNLDKLRLEQFIKNRLPIYFTTDEEKQRVILLRNEITGFSESNRQLICMAEACKLLGHEPVIITSKSSEDICQFIERHHVLHQVGNFIPRAIFNRFKSFFDILRILYTSMWIVYHKSSLKPNLVISHTNNLAVPILKYFGKIPVVHLQTFPESKIIDRSYFQFPPLRNFVDNYCIRSADEIIVPNKLSKVVFNDFYADTDRRISVIYPCVETWFFKKTPLVELSSFVDIPENGLFFVQFEAQNSKSNFELTVAAFGILMNSISHMSDIHKRMYLIIAGSFNNIDESSDYLRRIRYVELNVDYSKCPVHFLKVCPLNYTKALLSRCLAVVQPNIFDNNCTPFLAAGLMKKMVITAKSPIAKEIITHGHSGFFPHQDPADFAKFMFCILFAGKQTKRRENFIGLRFKMKYGQIKFLRSIQNVITRNCAEHNDGSLAIEEKDD